MVMPREVAAGALATFLLAVAAAGAPTGKWVEVRSPNFVVVSNASEGQARKTAVQFEQIRALYRDSLSYVKNSPSPVITIFAVKDENSLRELLPDFWAEKGHTHPAGIFQQGPYDQSQVAVNLSAAGENPFETVYHEYYHSVTVPYFPNLPTWVAEGMADFFGNSEIADKNATVGIPNRALLEELRSQPLIPLPVLFKVDHNSPYYNEQKKVSIFYAESWALMHYLLIGDKQAHSASFAAYLTALNQGATQEEAAAKAFGDIRKLQERLVAYIQNSSFLVFPYPAPAKVAESSLVTRTLTPAEVDAYSGGFLALHRQFEPAQSLLKEAAQLDPKLALAQRNLGFLHYFRNERADALAAFSAAVALDPQDPLTRYLRAQLTFDDVSQSDPQIEPDLRQAVAVKPGFADANALLAVCLARENDKSAEALAFGRKAIELQPGNLNFQLAYTEVLAHLHRYNDAEALGRRLLATATDDGIRNAADQMLIYITKARDYDAHQREMQEEAASRPKRLAAAQVEQATERAETNAAESNKSASDKLPEAGPAVDPNAPVLKRRVGANEIIGIVIQVTCNGPEMEVTTKVSDRPAPLVFHANDRTRIGYATTLAGMQGKIEPCSQLKGHTAKIDFIASEAKWLDGELARIEIEK